MWGSAPSTLEELRAFFFARPRPAFPGGYRPPGPSGQTGWRATPHSLLHKRRWPKPARTQPSVCCRPIARMEL
eukprot:15164843-Alexandrium_andersonii.AAC.1